MDKHLNCERGRLLVRFCSATNIFEDHLACFIGTKGAEFCSYNKEYIKTVCNVSDCICSTCDVAKWSHTSEGYSDARGQREVCKLCQALYDRITDKHALKSPNWANVKWQLILIEPLQHMKCYIKEHGYREVGNVRDLGLPALVQICSNHCDLNTLFGNLLPSLEQIAEKRDQVYQSETLHIGEDDLKTHLRAIEDVFKIVCEGADMDIRSHTLAAKIFNGDKQQFTVEDELKTLLNIIQTLDRRIHSLKCWHTLSGNNQDDPELKKLLFIKQVHCHKLQKHKQVLKNYTDEINKLCDDNSTQYRASGTVIVQLPHDKYNQTLLETQTLLVKDYDNGIETLENTNTHKKDIQMAIGLINDLRDEVAACRAGQFLVAGTAKEDDLRTVGQTESQGDLDSREIIRHINGPLETETSGEASPTTEARLISTGINTQEPQLCQKRSLKRPYQCLEIERAMVTVPPDVQPIRTEQTLTESPRLQQLEQTFVALNLVNAFRALSEKYSCEFRLCRGK